jgi:hypothetical protein
MQGNLQAKKELLAAAYDAFNKREIETVLAMMCADVDWPNGMEGGRCLGQSEVREYWKRQWGLMDPNVEPLRMEEDGRGRVVVDVHQVVRDLAGSVLVDQIVQHVYAIRDGLIERMDIQQVDAAG